MNKKTSALGFNDTLILGIVLAVALVHGLVYVFLMPPWQHYDEPNHFEYAWLLANNKRLPEPGEYDPEMSRQVVESMVELGFYDNLPVRPDVSPDMDVKITGFSQHDEPPLYYLLAALPLSLLQSQSITTQLYAARFVSLFLFLITILAAWGTIRELTAPGSPLRWLVPLALALMPGFVDLMTGVNNDAAAVALVSSLLWIGVRMIKRGFSFLGLVMLLLLAAMSVITKGTALIALPVIVVVLAFSLVRGRGRRFVWIGFGLLLLLGFAVVISWGDAAYWARSTFQEANTRTLTDQAPVGDHAFQLVLDPAGPAPYKVWIRQAIPVSEESRLSGQVLTLGSWMWASRPIQVRSPALMTFPGGEVIYEEVLIDETPQFVATVVQLGREAVRSFVSIEPVQGQVAEPVTIYVDGILLVRGEYPASETPAYSDAEGMSGIWGGVLFSNLLRNPSAEAGWPRLRSWVDPIGVQVLPDPGVNTPSVIFHTFLDWESGADYYWMTLQRLFRTFWSKFAWGHVPLLGNKPYRPLAVATLLGLLGVFLLIVLKWRKFPWEVGLLFLVSLALAWGAAIIRGSNYVLIPYKIYYPVARYAYPMIIPTVTLIVVGWYVLLSLLQRWTRLRSPILFLIPLVFLVILDVYAVISIANYYGSG